jgi:hypothetical protein
MPVPEAVAVGPAASVAVNPAEPAAEAPRGLEPAEQAAWEEIMSRAATHEVICIIRPKEPGGQSEIIALDNVSPEFIRALGEQRRAEVAPLAR